MANSTSLNELYFEILLAKNKLSVLQTYYTNIKNAILTDLTDLLNAIDDLTQWVNKNMESLSVHRSDSKTAVSNFTAYTASDSLIPNHAKYIEMKDLYESYVIEFYRRMHSLENSGTGDSYSVDNFLKNELADISSSWKFHYQEQYNDAFPVEHKFCAVNVTSESEILELSNNRYVYITNDNAIYDVDYNTKDVWISSADYKTFDPKSTQENAAAFNLLIANNHLDFVSLFTLPGTQKVYAFVNVGKVDVDESLIIGKEFSSDAYKFLVCEYDEALHKFHICYDKTSEIYVSKKLIDDGKKLTYIDDAVIGGYYFFRIDDIIARIAINSIVTDYTVTTTKFASKVNDILFYRSSFIVAGNTLNVALYPVDKDGTINTIAPDTKIGIQDALYGSVHAEVKVIKLFKSDAVGGVDDNPSIYFVTNTKIFHAKLDKWITDGKVYEDYRPTAILHGLSFVEPNLYTIDESGYIYYIYNHTNLYCSKVGIKGYKTKEEMAGVDLDIVESPTRYADKILVLKNVKSGICDGYAHNINGSITKFSEVNEGHETFIKSFINDGKLYAITEYGKVCVCDIASGAWEASSMQSFSKDLKITAIFEDDIDNGTLYFAVGPTSNVRIGVITRESIINRTTHATELIDINSGSEIKCMVYLDQKKTLYMGDIAGNVTAYDFNDFTYHTCDKTHPSYNENDDDNYAICLKESAINGSIYCITTDGINLIVMGQAARVASCSLATLIWTPYNTTDSVLRDMDSKICYDGKYFDTDGNEITIGRDIISFVNYNNAKLIVFTVEGYVFSCNLISGVWTTVIGRILTHNGTGFGPGISNMGTILGGKNVYATCRIGSTIFVAGENGRMGSIDVVTGGITEYRNTNASTGSKYFTVNDDSSGPGYSYQGEEFGMSNDIRNIISNGNGSIYILGTNSRVITYVTEANDVLTPSSDKLYYIGRRRSDYDYLSGLFVRVTKGTLAERVPLYPPNEDSGLFDNHNQNSMYVYKNGKHVWKLNSGLDIAYYSDNGGRTFTGTHDIENADRLPKVDTDSLDVTLNANISSIPVGVVNEKGEFGFIVNVGGTRLGTYFLNAKLVDGKMKLSWQAFEIRYTQDVLNTLKCANGLFYINYENKLVVLNDPDTRYNNIGWMEWDSDNSKLWFIKTDGNLYDSEDSVPFVTDLAGKLDSYCLKVIGISDWNILRFFVSTCNNFNFIIKSKCSNKLYLVTIHVDRIKDGDTEGNFYVSHAIINKLTDKPAKVFYDFTNSENYFIHVSNDGCKGFIAYNYIEDSKPKHIIIGMDLKPFGRYLESTIREIEDSTSYVYPIQFDGKDAKISYAYFNTIGNNYGAKVAHTNKIKSFKIHESIPCTPIRALTNAWKEVQVKLTQGDLFALRLKMVHTDLDSEADSVSKQFTLRYQVLITNLTNGKFILYEIEKSTGMSKTDDETKTVEPFFRVIAIDRFDDDIAELYTSKLDSYRHIDKTNTTVKSTYDFMTFFNYNGSEDSTYLIKIRPLNTLPTSIDAEFYLDLNGQSTIPNLTYTNNIDTSEFRELSSHCAYITNLVKRISISTEDSLGIIRDTDIANTLFAPQYDGYIKNDVGIADTYFTAIKGLGDGTYDKINCILQYEKNTWKVLPLSVNKKDLRYVFDDIGSSEIATNPKFDGLSASGGRSVHKMHNHSVFTRSVINSSDYYATYENEGNIVAVEGTLASKHGLFETVSTLDGTQKRIKLVSEGQNGSVWKTVTNAYDKIKNRNFKFAYDIIDHFSMFEDPYDMIHAFWIAGNKIVRGNERLLNMPYDEAISKDGSIAKKYLASDKLDVVEDDNGLYDSGDDPTNHGVTSAVYGVTSADTTEAIVEVVDEKFPLERWEGFEWADLLFIRKWRITYTNNTIRYRYELEWPMAETKNYSRTGLNRYITIDHIPIYGTEDFENTFKNFDTTIKPSIRRHLFYYTDNFDHEGVGKQEFNCLTVYYYKSHNWTVMKYDKQIVEHDFSEPWKSLYYDPNTTPEMLSVLKYNNKARHTVKTTNDVDNWYVTGTNNVYDIDNAQNTNLNHNDMQYYSEYCKDGTMKFITGENGFAKTVLAPRDKAFIDNVYSAFEQDKIIGETVTKLIAPLTEILSSVSVNNDYKLLFPENIYREANPGNKMVTRRRNCVLLGEKLTDGYICTKFNNDPSKELYEQYSVGIVDDPSLDELPDDLQPHTLSSLGGKTHASIRYCEPEHTTDGYKSLTYDKANSLNTNTFHYEFGLRDIYIFDPEERKFHLKSNKTLWGIEIIQYHVYPDAYDSNYSKIDNWQDFNVKSEFTEFEAVTNWNGTGNFSGDTTHNNIVEKSSVLQGYYGAASYKYLYRKEVSVTTERLQDSAGEKAYEWLFCKVFADDFATINGEASEAPLNEFGYTKKDIHDLRRTCLDDEFFWIGPPNSVTDAITLSDTCDRVFLKQFIEPRGAAAMDLDDHSKDWAKNYYQKYSYLEFNGIESNGKIVDYNYAAKYCWCTVDPNSLYPTTDTITDEDILKWTISGKLHYQWQDGSVCVVPFNNEPIEKLLTLTPDEGNPNTFVKYFKEAEKITEYDSTKTQYQNTYLLTLGGVNIENNDDEAQFNGNVYDYNPDSPDNISNITEIRCKFVTDVRYTKDIDQYADDVPTNTAANWQPISNPEHGEVGTNGNQASTDSENRFYNITFNVPGCTSSNTDFKIQHHHPWTTIIAANEETATAPTTIRVVVGNADAASGLHYRYSNMMVYPDYYITGDRDLSIVEILRSKKYGHSIGNPEDLAKDDETFFGWSLNGRDPVSYNDLDTIVPAWTELTLYRIYNSTRHATLEIYGPVVEDDIKIGYGGSEYEPTIEPPESNGEQYGLEGYVADTPETYTPPKVSNPPRAATNIVVVGKNLYYIDGDGNLIFFNEERGYEAISQMSTNAILAYDGDDTIYIWSSGALYKHIVSLTRTEQIGFTNINPIAMAYYDNDLWFVTDRLVKVSKDDASVLESTNVYAYNHSFSNFTFDPDKGIITIFGDFECDVISIASRINNRTNTCTSLGLKKFETEKKYSRADMFLQSYTLQIEAFTFSGYDLATTPLLWDTTKYFGDPYANVYERNFVAYVLPGNSTTTKEYNFNGVVYHEFTQAEKSIEIKTQSITVYVVHTLYDRKYVTWKSILDATPQPTLPAKINGTFIFRYFCIPGLDRKPTDADLASYTTIEESMIIPFMAEEFEFHTRGDMCVVNHEGKIVYEDNSRELKIANSVNDIDVYTKSTDKIAIVDNVVYLTKNNSIIRTSLM